MTTLDSGVGSKWALALDGRGYLLSTLDEQSPFEFRAYTLEPIPLRIPRIDLSSEPGEQSIGNLWPRAQHSWHDGEGQTVFDSEFSSRFQVRKSHGLDLIKEKGGLYLTPNTEALYDSSMYSMIAVGDNLLVNCGAYVSKYLPTHAGAGSEGDVTIAVETGAYSMASDGKLLYVTTAASGIKSIDTSISWGSPPTPVAVNNLNADVMGFAKGRLMVGIGNALHVITDLTTITDGATAVWSHLSTDWDFTVFAETGPGIYAAGFAGEVSELLFISFEAADIASGVTLGVPRTAWKAPSGEKILSLSSYSGAAMLMGTSKGLRNVIVNDQGDVQVSKLLVETPDPCQKVEAGSDYGYFIFGDDGYEGDNDLHVGKIDLGTFAWTRYLNEFGSSKVISDLVIWAESGSDGEVPFIVATSPTVSGTTYVYNYTSSPISSYGEFLTGEIRFGTFEEKYLRKIDLLLNRENRGLQLDYGSATEGDIFLSSLNSKSVTQPSGAVDERVVELKVRLSDMTGVNSRVWALSHGEPYGDDGGNIYDLKDFFWNLQFTDDAGTTKPRFIWRAGSALVKTATSTVDLNTIFAAEDVFWLKVVFDGDVGGVWQVKFYYYDGDTDEPGSYTQLGTTVSGSSTSDFHNISVSYPYFFGGHNLTGGANSADIIYKARVWEDVAETQRTMDWEVEFPYVDSDGNTYTIEPRKHVTDEWVTYEVDELDPNFDPRSNIRISGATYAIVSIKSDGGSWRPLGRFYDKQEKDLGVEFLGVRFEIRIGLQNMGIGPYNTLDDTKGLMEWRLRAEPVPKPRYLRHFVPVMLYDRMTTIDGSHINRVGYSHDELAILKSKYREGDLLDFQPPDLGDSIKVRIDELHFKQFAPPKGAAGFGGIALLVLREQE